MNNQETLSAERGADSVQRTCSACRFWQNLGHNEDDDGDIGECAILPNYVARESADGKTVRWGEKAITSARFGCCLHKSPNDQAHL